MASGRVPKITSTRFITSFVNEGELLVTVSDSALGEVVGRHLKGYAITGQNAYAVAPELACQMRKNCSVLIELNAEQPAREFFYDCASYFYAVFFTHSPLTTWDRGGGLHASRATVVSIPQRSCFQGTNARKRTCDKQFASVLGTA